MAFGTGFWNTYPGTDLHEIDLHYVLMQLLQLRKDMQEVVDSQAITFADPINWNITSQYPANQVVLDSNGDGYISRQPVPAGIPLSNTNYWTQIFSFNDIADRIRASIAVNAGSSATTPEALAENDLVWWQGDIYRAMVAMPAGTAFIEGTNVERYTVDEKISAFISQIGAVAADLAQEVLDREDADTALGDADTALGGRIDQEILDCVDMETGEITRVIVADELADGMSLRPTNLIFRDGSLFTINGYITGMVTQINVETGAMGGISICPDYWGDFNGGRSMIEDPLTGEVYAIRDMRTEYIGTPGYTGKYSTSVLCTISLGVAYVEEVATVGTNIRLTYEGLSQPVYGLVNIGQLERVEHPCAGFLHGGSLTKGQVRRLLAGMRVPLLPECICIQNIL